ncbi:MAG: hypothetical protein IT440_10535 [Phycisphaeraceae bacterium]|nr:hypothetical protein [Phycisphaeraceae bacterium]
MTAKMTSQDPDIQASFAAMKRAAKLAMRRAKETGTPLYVMQDGKIVNLNPGGRLRKKLPAKLRLI